MLCEVKNFKKISENCKKGVYKYYQTRYINIVRNNLLKLNELNEGEIIMKKTLTKELESKNSVYEVARFTKEHIDFLVWFDNYNEDKAREIISNYMAHAFHLSCIERSCKENNEDFSDMLKDFVRMSVETVIEVETTCK